MVKHVNRNLGLIVNNLDFSFKLNDTPLMDFKLQPGLV